MYKIILQNTKTTLQHTGIQYTVTILENQGRCLSWPLSQGKCNVTFYFFKLFLIFNIFFFKSLLFADQMIQKLLKLVQKNQQGVELKQIIFFSNDNRALDFYCLKPRKTWRWMGDVWFYGVIINCLHG